MQEVNKPSYKKIILRVLVLVVYLSIGGALFQLFEKSYHVAANKKYRQMLKSFRDRYNISEKDMNDLEMTIIQDGKHSMNNDWNLSNAIFFAGTTVLTVGKLRSEAGGRDLRLYGVCTPRKDFLTRL